MYDVKDDFLCLVETSKNNKYLTEGCRKLFSSIFKRIKTSDETSILQFIECVAGYHDTLLSSHVEDKQILDTPIDEDQEMEEFKKFIESVSQEVISEKSKESAITKNIYDKVNWIKRPMMIMTITEDRININKSFMEYLVDVDNSIPSNRSYEFVPVDMELMGDQMYRDQYNENYDINENDKYVDCVIGIDDTGNILLTIMSGVSDLNKFKMYEGKDIGYLKKDDVKLFHMRTGHKYSGKYLFEVNDELRSLVSKKIYPIEVNE